MSAVGIKYKEDLVARIRDLIDGYDSSSILKEYLQNADDSGATELIITFDKQEYDGLEDTRFSRANGPALLISNNSIFKEKDFDSIVQISAQGKAKDALSTGRFGQGFSSSFSISDHPSFISNGRAYWFDVRKNAVSKGHDEDILLWKQNSFSDINIWLESFKGVDYNSFLKQKGTIFRLPLRTVTTIKNDNADNKISDDVFTYENFLSWCDEWKDKAENLLFLRSVQKLVLQEIDKNGNKIVHLNIETINHEEVQEVNSTIANELNDKSLESICKNWMEVDKELPVLQYKQLFSIQYLSRETLTFETSKENWAVVNGLFRGEDNSLIKQALKALDITPNPRKVLPWAGAAIQLTDKNKPIKKQKQWYTFLPLPLEMSYQVHLQGWFDLNPKRTEITHGGSGSDKSILTDWNQTLMEYGVGVSWAMLLEFIKMDIDTKAFYKLWPNLQSVKGLDKYLINGFYTKICEFESIHVSTRNSSYWKRPSSDIHILKEQDIELSEALREHFEIAIPNPSEYIIQSLNLTSPSKLVMITSTFIKTYLLEVSKKEEFPVSLSDISIKMFSKKEWLLHVLKFCADDNGYEDMYGLPFELRADEKVNLIGKTDVLFDANADLELFQNIKSLIIDSSLVEMLEFDKTPRTWLLPSLKNIISLLLDNWEMFNLNIEWVKLIVQYIARHRDDIKGTKNLLNQLPIVYRDDKTWVELKIDVLRSSPFIVKNEDKKNIDMLKEMGMQFVHADYMSIYRDLSNEGLIARLSEETLSKHLLSCREYSFLENELLREYIVDKLSDSFEWYDNSLNKQGKEQFKKIPFIFTTSDNLCSVVSQKVFISTDFKPPKHVKSLSSDYELVEPRNEKESNLYIKVGIQKQTAKNYILDTIIPFLENSDDRESCISILEWLASDWVALCSKFTDGQKEEVVSILKRSKIIPDLQSVIFIKKLPSKIYHPSVKLPECLKDNLTYQTIVFDNKKIQLDWESFLSDLGASIEIFPDHIYLKAKQIENKQDESMYWEAVGLANYIIDNINSIETLHYMNGMLLEELKALSWLPIEVNSELLLKPTKVSTPFMQAKNLIRYSDVKIVGGIYHVLSKDIVFKTKSSDYEPRDIAKKMGIVISLPIEDVYESFNVLRALNTDNENAVIEYALEFYKYLGRQKKLETNEIPGDIKERSIRINKQWISVEHVFKRASKLNGIYCWSDISPEVDNEHSDNNLREGLELLGVKDMPSTQVLVDLLNAIPKNQELSKNDNKQAELLLDEIKNIYDIEEFSFPIMSRKKMLLDRGDLYISDLPAYNKAEIRNEELEFCRDKYKDLARRLGVDSLKDCKEEKLNKEKTIFGKYKTNDSSDDLIVYIRSSHFKEGLLRLLFDENKISEEEIYTYDLNSALPGDVLIVEKLVVDFFAYSTFIYTDLEASTLETDDKLYILRQDELDDMIDIVSQDICHTKRLSDTSLQYLMRMLRNTMSAEKINLFLDKKGVRELPSEISFEKESIYLEDDEEYCKHNEAEDGHETNFKLGDGALDGSFISEHEFLNDAVNENTSETASINNLDNQVSNSQETKDFSNESNLSSNSNEGMSSSNDSQSESSFNASNQSTEHTEQKNDSDVPPPTTPKGSQDDVTSNKNTNSEQDTTSEDSNSSYGGHAGSRSESNGNSTSDPVSSNDRKPVYVGNEKERDEEKSKEKREQAKKIGDKGENYILSDTSLLRSPNNHFIKAPTNNKGFDIVEKDKQGNIIRYIEVKTLTGKWGTGGVGITINQLQFALEHKDKWWLIVVKGINTDNIEVFEFKNPVIEATSFMFDSSWKQLAYTDKNNNLDTNVEPSISLPQKGEIYNVSIDGRTKLYEITKVKSTGKLLYVWALCENEESPKKVNFNSSWEKI